jgi:predicted aspartyl protease
MKLHIHHIILLSLVFVLIISCSDNSKKEDARIVNKLSELHESQDYFKLKTFYKSNKSNLSKKSSLYFDALIQHHFNNQLESNKLIDKLLNEFQEEIPDTLLQKVFEAKLMNHINLYEYKNAAECSKVLIRVYNKLIDSVKLKSLNNEFKIWKALSNTPKQEVIKNSDSKIVMKRDKVGLMNISATFKNDMVPFIFDTGANFSAIKRSIANKLNLEIIEADFYVTAATGKEVKSSLAIAKEFYLENILVKNAVFLVFEDEDLSFPQVDYYPNGILGFPVIEAMEELHFNINGDVFIPETPVAYSFENLALDGLMPIIAVNYKQDTLNFNFDTGGSTTMLYSPFYKKYQSYIDKNYQLEEFSSSSGGGSKNYEGYILDSISLGVANSSSTLKKIRLHKDPIYEISEKTHGNFGQDYIKQFNTMILSFKHSSIIFKN